MALLQVVDLHKSYSENPAVNGLSFHVEKGQIFGLLGPNGAGKTTTMSMIAGLLQPDSGSIHIDNKQLQTDTRSTKMMLGVVPQDLAVYPDLTAFENLNFFGQLYGLSGLPLKQQIDSSLERTGLTQNAHKLAKTFSGGMKRRLNFAVALIHQPQLLILDEPTVGVDPQSRSHLLDCIKALSQEGVGIVYASHYMEEVQAICDSVAIIDHGQMLASGTLDELLSRLNVDVQLKVVGDSTGLDDQLKQSAEIHSSNSNETIITVTADTKEGFPVLNGPLKHVLKILDDGNLEVRSITTAESSLERLFLELTGHSLRD